jgi:NAD(P)-dependent dehydrogenase (short-subunit alcohol dehydrogenase family)
MRYIRKFLAIQILALLAIKSKDCPIPFHTLPKVKNNRSINTNKEFTFMPFTVQFQGKVCLITGASRGLGRALALEFARKGASLVINSRPASSAGLAETERQVSALGAPVLSVIADVSVRPDIERLAGEALARFNQVDILINNASALGPVPMPYLIDYPIHDFEQVMRTNVNGPFMLTRALVGQMLSRSSGSIINVSSDAGVVGYPAWGAYGVSKAALDQLTRTWAAELEGTGVRANCVDPGDMNTAMKRASDPDGDASQWADPATVTPVFLYLASDESASINGQRFDAQEFVRNGRF